MVTLVAFAELAYNTLTDTDVARLVVATNYNRHLGSGAEVFVHKHDLRGVWGDVLPLGVGDAEITWELLS